MTATTRSTECSAPDATLMLAFEHARRLADALPRIMPCRAIRHQAYHGRVVSA